MTPVVLDSGVFIASVFVETLSVQARQLIGNLRTQGFTFHAPILLRYELVAVSRKAVYQGRITSEEGIRALDLFLSYSVVTHFDDALLKRAYEIATTLNRPTAYDAQYLALAERLNCSFWTADERLYNSAQARLSNLFWLGNLTL